jgi:hypothetical protein
MKYEKHIGIYQSRDELTADLNELKLKSPWVGYVAKPEGGFEVYYSNDMGLGNDLNIAETLMNEIQILKDSVETLTEDEYEHLVALPEGGEMTITNINGIKKEKVQFNPNVRYYTYNPDDLPNIE